MDGWNEFAEEIIKELTRYDREHTYSYLAYYMQDNPTAVVVLADIMREINRRSVWQKMPGPVENTEAK